MKSMNSEIVRAEIEKGLAQVDKGLSIDDFSCSFDEATRSLSVKFTASNGSGETMDIKLSY